MISEALDYLRKHLGKANSFDVGGVQVWDREVHRAPLPHHLPMAEPVFLSTLESLAAYLGGPVADDGRDDELSPMELIVHVATPLQVRVLRHLEGEHRQRERLAVANAESAADRYLDSWLDLETMVIGLMSTFSAEGERDEVLELLKGVKTEGAEIRDDDGMSQAVTIQSGVKTLKMGKTKNPVFLRPFRTFPEVTNAPSSPFLLRLRQGDNGPQATLRQADGGAWEVECKRQIAAVLTDLISSEIDADSMPTILY